MTGFWPTLLVGLSSFISGMFLGYAGWRKTSRLRMSPQGTVWAVAPLLGGSIAGLIVVLAILPSILAPQDRFYTAHDVFKIVTAIVVALAILFMNYYIALFPFVASRWWLRWGVRAISEFIACVIVALAGVRFSVLSPIPTTELSLGVWALPATILWMLFAMNVVKLLDGLEGAASVLLLVASVAVFFTTLGTAEHFLHAFTTLLAGASLASLRFTAYPARLSLRGAGTSIAGFFFAVLTVLARQKTVAALLFVFPLVVIVILVAGVVLGSLERILFPDGEEQ